MAVIPARGGSKRLPRKNILPLVDIPLIVWSIEAARESKYIDKCIVSTDDDKISNIVKKFGGEIPFKRPAHLATDESATFDVLEHGINYFKNQLCFSGIVNGVFSNRKIYCGLFWYSNASLQVDRGVFSGLYFFHHADWQQSIAFTFRG